MPTYVIRSCLRHAISPLAVQNYFDVRPFQVLSHQKPCLRYYGNEETKQNSVRQQDDHFQSERKLSTELESLSMQFQELERKHAELLDKYKRALADGENLRIRLNKQIEDAKIFGIQKFCKDLLEVADILGHATESVPLEEVSETNPHLKSLFEGLSMTRASLMQVFKRHGVTVVNPLNEKFDPNLHEALYQKPVNNGEANIVIEVSKIGYKLHERCIRPALVGVSK